MTRESVYEKIRIVLANETVHGLFLIAALICIYSLVEG